MSIPHLPGAMALDLALRGLGGDYHETVAIWTLVVVGWWRAEGQLILALRVAFSLIEGRGWRSLNP